MRKVAVRETPMSFRLDPVTAELIKLTCATMGVSQRDVLRMAVRAFARRQGVALPPDDEAVAPTASPAGE